MAIPIPFGDVLKSISERKKFEKESEEKFRETLCSCCKQKIVSNGNSKISGICNNCISKSMKE